jgi:hypothetical protein
MNPAQRAARDQLTASIRDTWGAMLWAFYTGCRESGFSEDAAFDLTTSWLESMVLKNPGYPPHGQCGSDDQG